jgi:tetratricopeptide (TPR) repeat protein
MAKNPIRVLYGVTINDTIKRGNKEDMKALLKEAKALHKKQGDLAESVSALEKALKKPGIDPRPLYGVPAHDAIKRGNRTEIEALLTQARAAQRDQGDLGQAIEDLNAAIKRK